MNIKQTTFYFVTIFALVIVVSAIVIFLYSLIIHSSGAVNWDTSLQLAIIFSIVFTWLNYQEKKKVK